MRTYSHALLTLHAFRHHAPGVSAAASLGAALPDLPALAGAAWLAANRLGRFSREDFETEVCARDVFGRPDAALHSALTVCAAMALHASLRVDPRGTRTPLSAFLLGWAGHVVADTLTHGTDARAPFWPLSAYRFRSPVSYRERDRHALPFTLAEHAAALLAARETLAHIFSPSPR